MVYNISGMLNASSALSLAQGTNVLFGGYMFGYCIIAILFFVTFMVLKQQGYSAIASFTASWWFITIVSFLLKPADLIDAFTFWAVLLIMILSTGMLYLSGNSD